MDAAGKDACQPDGARSYSQISNVVQNCKGFLVATFALYEVIVYLKDSNTGFVNRINRYAKGRS